jgi:hypothetical protein
MSSSSVAERLFYQITLTAPATRSQGWKGTLYDRAGRAIEVEPGKSMKTNIGEFVSVACTLPWVPCGMIQSEVASWMKTHESNVIIDSRSCEYRIYVSAEGSKSEGWRGELVMGGSIVTPQFERVLAPVGIFVWSENFELWGLHGWFHEAWVTAERPAQKDFVDDVESKMAEWKAHLREKFEVRTPAAVCCVRG